MRINHITTALAASCAAFGASASAIVRRQDESTISTPTITSSSTSLSPTSSVPTAALVVETMSNGEKTTFEVNAPQPAAAASSGTANGTVEASTSTSTHTISTTGQPAQSTRFPHCTDPNAKPFCLPHAGETLFVGKQYFVTWNPDFFPANSTVVIKVQFANDTSQQVWSSLETDNGWGYTVVETTKEWKQGYSMFNLTFTALNYDKTDASLKATSYNGPDISLTDESPNHLPPSAKTKIHKEGLMIGLPVALGGLFLVLVGLFIGMRKHRTIGLGNIMGRRNRGYGVGKSRRQRMGLGKKEGAIRLEEREVIHTRTHTRSDSFGSLVSDDDIRPAPRGDNLFRDEVERQRTGR